MAVIAVFTYEIEPGRLDDFLAILKRAAGPEFTSAVMPRAVRLLRNIVPGPDSTLILHIEYDDMAAYGARTSFENSNPAWHKLFAPTTDAPARLVSVALLTEL